MGAGDDVLCGQALLYEGAHNGAADHATVASNEDFGDWTQGRHGISGVAW